MQKNEPISFEKWHYPYLTDIVNLQEDFFDWMENKVCGCGLREVGVVKVVDGAYRILRRWVGSWGSFLILYPHTFQHPS